MGKIVIFEKTTIKNMNFPQELKYTKEHEWIKVEGDSAFIGITDFAQKELGDIVFVDIDTIGETIEQNDVFGTIEAVKTVSDLFMPVAAEVLSVNENLNSNPEFINNDPYGKGWVIKVRILKNDQMNSLMSADEYKKLVGA